MNIKATNATAARQCCSETLDMDDNVIQASCQVSFDFLEQISSWHSCMLALNATLGVVVACNMTDKWYTGYQRSGGW